MITVFQGTYMAQIPIPTTDDNYKKISKFVMEYPQKVVEIDGIDGFIIILDEFQILKKLRKPDDFSGCLEATANFNQM